MKIIEKALADIKITLDVILENSTMQRIDDTVLDEHYWKNFPLSTVEEIEDFEKKLKSDKNYKINLVIIC